MDVDLERLGPFPVEAQGKRFRQQESLGGGNGREIGRGIDNNGIRVAHGLRFQSVRVREIRCWAAVPRAALLQPGREVVVRPWPQRHASIRAGPWPPRARIVTATGAKSVERVLALLEGHPRSPGYPAWFSPPTVR